eukprot:6213528-Pleurochrysis_carterae.AAC.3
MDNDGTQLWLAANENAYDQHHPPGDVVSGQAIARIVLCGWCSVRLVVADMVWSKWVSCLECARAALSVRSRT